MEKMSLAKRVRALRHEIKGPDMGGKPRVCGCHRCAEVSSIAAELERIAGHLRGDLRDDEYWTALERGAIRTAVADYMRSEGCSCCRDSAAHRKHERILARLLRVPKYTDGSGYNFAKYQSKEEA